MLSKSGHLLYGFFAAEAREFARVDQLAVERGEGKSIALCGSDIPVRAVRRNNYLPDFNPVFLRKLIIALIVRRDAHDRTGAVVHQNVVSYPDRHTLAVIGIHREISGINAVFLDFSYITAFFCFRLLSDKLIDSDAQPRVGVSQFLGDRVLRRKLDRSRAKDCVHPRGENRDRLASGGIQTKIHERAFTAADPVALHGANFFRPAG